MTGAEARMEFLLGRRRFRHVARPAHADRFGQEGVDAAHPGMFGAIEFGVEVHHLVQRVHAGVGAAGAGGAQLDAGEALYGVLQLVLHGLAVRLDLVAKPVGAVVLNP